MNPLKGPPEKATTLRCRVPVQVQSIAVAMANLKPCCPLILQGTGTLRINHVRFSTFEFTQRPGQPAHMADSPHIASQPTNPRNTGSWLPYFWAALRIVDWQAWGYFGQRYGWVLFERLPSGKFPIASVRLSRSTFPILSRDPSFQETIKTPAKTAGF